VRPASARAWPDALSGGLQARPKPSVPSLWDDGLWYTHPERDEIAIVWAQDEAAIAEVLTYHYPHDWSHLRVLTA